MQSSLIPEVKIGVWLGDPDQTLLKIKTMEETRSPSRRRTSGAAGAKADRVRGSGSSDC